jgi:hypothetical protein
MSQQTKLSHFLNEVRHVEQMFNEQMNKVEKQLQRGVILHSEYASEMALICYNRGKVYGQHVEALLNTLAAAEDDAILRQIAPEWHKAKSEQGK